MLAIRYNILENDWKMLLVKECWMGLESTMSVKLLRGKSYRMQWIWLVVWTFGESGCGVRCEQCFIAFEVREMSLFGS